MGVNTRETMAVADAAAGGDDDVVVVLVVVVAVVVEAGVLAALHGKQLAMPSWWVVLVALG
jgi:hypothetical protein